ncbi:MAG: PAS domain-containing protein [Sulfuriferula sp.]|nr:PAS domain-containing protein [Sulfuriferula sp.]
MSLFQHPFFAYPAADASDHVVRGWKSLHYLNLYRLIISGVFLLSTYLDSNNLRFEHASTVMFAVYSTIYLGLAALFIMTISLRRPSFNVQLNMQVLTDIVMVVLMMMSVGGVRSGLGLLLVVTVASSGLVAQGRIALFHAAIAVFGVLLVQTLSTLNGQQAAGDYAQAGLLGIVFFVTAGIAQVLAQRLRVSEALASARAVDLENMAQINQLVIDDMQDGVVVLDGESGIRQANQRALVLLGAANVDLSSVPVLLDYLSQWRKNPLLSFPPVTLGNMDGQYLPRFIAVTDKRVMGAVLVLEDMTHINAQAQQIKLAALGRLTANIAHEIRNPLAAISHATEILQEDAQANKTQQRLLEIVLNNTQRINHLVTDVMALNRRDRAQVERVVLFVFLTKLVDEFRQAHQLDVTWIQWTCLPALAISFDSAHLWQVMSNLLLNAVRHSQQQPGSVFITVAQTRNVVTIDVQDDGAGVKPENLTQLFEPFFTTVSTGTGLGLYISKELCLANQASLEYVPGMGGHFRISCLEARC